MIETHPFGDFVPKNAQYLLLGSFTGKSVPIEPGYDWYYGTKRNQFWKIIGNVYNEELQTKEDKIRLFTKLNIAVSDIIYQCERAKNSNLDTNLINIVYNYEAIRNILASGRIKKIFFTSRFVETTFRRHVKVELEFPDIEFITLPSPSPRYAKVTLNQKVEIYRKVMPHK